MRLAAIAMRRSAVIRVLAVPKLPQSDTPFPLLCAVFGHFARSRHRRQWAEITSNEGIGRFCPLFLAFIAEAHLRVGNNARALERGEARKLPSTRS
jgi:hypothetical protein